MPQQQWLDVIEELGGYHAQLPIPNSFDHDQEKTQFSRAFLSTAIESIEPPEGCWTSGPSLDGKGEYSVKRLLPLGDEPQLAPPMPEAFAQLEQMQAGKERVAATGASSNGVAAGGAFG